MMTVRIFAILFACLTSLSSSQAWTYSSLAGGSSCQPNYNLNWINGTSGGHEIAANLQYPLCAYDNHHGATSQSYSYLMGGYDGANEPNLYVTTDGFNTLAFPPINASTIGARRLGLGAVTKNGTVIFVSGETGTTIGTLDGKVFYSLDHGQTFSVATLNAPMQRAEGQLISIPYTNNIILIGGYNAANSQTNDVWISQDGIGAVWTRQTAASPLPTNALAGCVALHDNKFVNPALYSSPNSTILFFLEYSYGDYWMSYDLGRTWTQNYVYPFATSSSSVGHRDWLLFTADQDNYIYFTGLYNNPDPSVWVSHTKGQTWALLTQSMSIPGVSSTLMYYWSMYGCISFGYNPQTLAKQIYLYGYQQIMSDGSVYQSLIGEVDVPYGQPGYGVLPNATILATSAAIGILPSVSSPSCAYNVHTLTSSPAFYTIGGQVGATGSSAAYRSTDGLTFSLQGSSALPANLYNAGSAMLSNGNLLVIGGQTSNTSFSSAVFVSMDNGNTFTVSNTSAAFGARTGIITCVQPGSNTVVVIGGSTTTTTISSDVWINIDGTGAVWTLVGKLPTTTLAGSCVFLYDSSSISSTYTSPNSTLLVFTHTGRLYRSYNLGASFDPKPSSITPGPLGYQYLPFSTQFDSSSTRIGIRVVADYDNYLYATGGLNIYDNGIYFSGDLGFTWYRVNQINNLNTGDYIMASTSCLGLSYRSAGSSVYTKTLSLYGGVSIMFDNNSNYSAISITVDATPNFIPSVSGVVVSTTVMKTQADNAQLWCPFNASLPAIQWQQVTPIATIPTLQYPFCGRDVHHLAVNSSTNLYMYGGYTSTASSPANTARLYATNDGFNTLLPATHTDSIIGVRRMGSMAVMPNNDVLVLGGQTGTSSGTAANDVYVSHDGGATFAFVNNTFPVRYETQVLTIPMTNNIVLIGGYNAAGQETNDIYISTDGLGAIWSLQTSSSPVPTNALAGSIALFDSKFCNPALYSSPNSTIFFFLEYSLGDYWMSYDLGRTWSVNYVYPFSTGLTSASQVTHRDWLLFGADLDNYIYHFGMYNNPDQTMWISRDKGQHWLAMDIAPSIIPGVSAYTFIMWSYYGCGAFQYGTNTQTGQRVKQFVTYGYQNWQSDGTLVSAAVANLLNVPNVQGFPYAPNATLQTSLPVTAITNGQSAACAYNVHARNGVMMAMGGAAQYGNASSSNSIFTASLNSFVNNGSSNLVSYDISASVPSSSGGGLTLLNSGNVLYFGGQNVDGSYSNAVYSSSSTTGIAFTSVGNAPWTPRANFITCTMPYSDTVVVIGGSSTSNTNDMWISSSSTGATWTRRTAVPWTDTSVQAGTCVFLYDSSLVPGARYTQQYSTLIVFTHTNHYYRSVDLGQSWIAIPDINLALAPSFQTAPWSSQFDNSAKRFGIEVVVDFDNHMYAMAGTNVWDNTIWWSGDKAFTWYRMKQINTLNSAYFIQASTSCLGLNYRQGATSGSNYNKTLVLYGGNIQFDDGSKIGAMQIVLDNPVTFIPTNPNAPTFNIQLAPRSSSTGVSSSAAASSSAQAVSSSVAAATRSSSAATPISSTRADSFLSSSTSASNDILPNSSDSSSSNSLSGGAIAGIVVGCVFGVALICAIAFLCGVLKSSKVKKAAANYNAGRDGAAFQTHEESSMNHSTIEAVEMA